MQRQALFLLLLLSAAPCSPAAEPLHFRVLLDKESADQPITGRPPLLMYRDEAGKPRPLARRGRIDPKVADAWHKYDIRLLLEKNWPELGPKLKGKLHITTGELDTFYLEAPSSYWPRR